VAQAGGTETYALGWGLGKARPGAYCLVPDTFFQGGPGICLQAMRRLRCGSSRRYGNIRPSGGAWGKRATEGVLLVSDTFFQGGPADPVFACKP
jgi:hypothetical protein